MTVAFSTGHGVPNWEQRHRESPVPGRWPYGLDQLSLHFADVRSAEVPPLRRGQRALAHLVGMRGRSGKGIALAWDELTGVQLLAGLPAARRYCGVIWATDQVTASAPVRHLELQRRALRTMDGVWVLSRPQVEAVRAWLGPGGPPVHFLPFGIDEGYYRSAPFAGSPVVASVGGDRDRDPATLLAALEVVTSRRPDVECVVQSRSDLPAPLGVTKVARLSHDEVRRLFARSQVVALATRPNLHASGMTVSLEAMSVGRPVVACSTPGMDDYVLHGRTGHLVPPGDGESMARSILQLLDDPAEAAAMGQRGRAHIEARHTTRAMCAALASIVSET